VSEGATSYEDTQAQAQAAVEAAKPSADSWLAEAQAWVDADMPAGTITSVPAGHPIRQ
jgi:hypothetical protein